VAIEAASAFQRLGVAVGSLGDPLQLLNQSLNDPSGIQDSLIEISKQFTYFDDKTKSFKVSQEGILRFKELEQTTGISAAEMSKLGVAALEVDKRLSQISPSIKFENEEDKQYLANIARMGDGGEYEVEIKNAQGDEQIKKLSEVTQTELNKLIDEQKQGEKSIEELTRDQMTLQEVVAADVAAIRTSITGGVVTAPTLQSLNEEIRKLTEGVGNDITSNPNIQTKEVREEVDRIFSDLEGDLSKIVLGGNFEPEKIFETLIAGEKLQELNQKTKETIEDISKKIGERLKEKFSDGQFESNTTSSTEDKVSRTNTPVNSTNTSSTNISVEGLQASSSNTGLGSTQPNTRKLNVEFGGKIPDINVNFNNAPPNMTAQQIDEWKKMFQSVVNEQYFRNYLIKVTEPSGTEMATY
jgi:hypothetical protein